MEHATSPYKGRFKDLPWFNGIPGMNNAANTHGCRIAVIGVGGIGSWLSLFLARAGVQVELFDMDHIEPHNLGGQLYASGFMGMNKAEAMREMLRMLTDNDSVSINETGFRPSYQAPIILFSAVDNMAVRKLLFEKWLKAIDSPGGHVGVFIDGRMLAEDGQIYIIRASDPDAIECYRTKHLFSDEEVKDEMCTAKATSHCGAMIGAMMAQGYFNHVTNIEVGYELREVPFKQEFHLQLMQFEQYGAESVTANGASLQSESIVDEGQALEQSESSSGQYADAIQSVQDGAGEILASESHATATQSGGGTLPF